MPFDFTAAFRSRRNRQDLLLLPAAYQRVEWIGSAGSAFIQTNVRLTNGSVRLHTMLQCTGSSHYGGDFFGVRAGTNAGQQGIMIKVNSDRSDFFCSSSNGSGAVAARISRTAVPYAVNSVVEIDALLSEGNAASGTVSCNFTVNGVSGSDADTGVAASNTQARLGILGSATASTRAIGKIFGFAEAWNDGRLVLYAVPCYHKADGVIGMYDTVNGIFYTNAGSGSFTKGADV